MTNVYKNFRLSEMDCHDGTKVPPSFVDNATEVLRRLQIVRDFYGDRIIRIRSGFRTEAHNKAVGGEDRSQHLTASAADFTVEGVSPRQVVADIEGLIRVGALPDGGLGSYITFTHLDVRPNRARWRG